MIRLRLFRFAVALVALVWVVASCSGGRSPASTTDASVSPASLDAKAQVRAAYVAARQAEGASDPAYAVRAGAVGAFEAEHTGMRMHTELGADGATLSKAGEPWSVTLAGSRVGCSGGTLATIERGAPRAGSTANRVEYAGRAAGAQVDEWYVNGPLGLEQGFTLGASPCTGAGGDVVIEVRTGGLSAVASPGAEGLELWDAAGTARVRYTDLWAVDAAGATLPARMETSAAGIALRVDAHGARFPVTVDPTAWLVTQTLAASDGAARNYFGSSVVISGTTAIVGAYGNNFQQGAAYVFVRSGTTWTQQARLVASDGAADDSFGASVAISGTTAIIGAYDKTVGANMFQGAAYVFVQAGTTWTQQAKLVASDGALGDYFGISVAVTGATALVGAGYKTVGANAVQGAAYVFVQSGTTWSQQAKVVASDGAANDFFGISVAVAGTTAFVGAPYKTVGGNADQGAVYVFVQAGTTWGQQTKLVASDGAANDGFGDSVAISGTTALVGAPDKTVGTNSSQGAAYVFVQAGTTWSQQAKLVASDGAANDSFGSVSISGATAIVGAGHESVGTNAGQGAAYVFAQVGTTWSQQAKVVASDGAANDNFGAVSISGTTAVVGAYRKTVGANANQGAAYIAELALTDGSSCTTATQCGSGFCVADVCCNTSCGGCGDCTTGTCTLLTAGSAGSPTCSPEVCSGTSATCPTNCSSDTGCIATDYCSVGACIPKQPDQTTCSAGDQCTSGNCAATGICTENGANGTACTSGDDCQTSFCAQGVCCTTACAPACEACNVAGSAGTCSAVPSGGAGSPSCAPYVCNGTSATCPATCAQDSQCAPADYCSGGSCITKQVSGSICAANDQCASNNCVSGTCVGTQPNGTACTTSDQCVDGNCAGGFCCATACAGACATCSSGTCQPLATGAPGAPSCSPFACDGTDQTCPSTCTADTTCVAVDYCNAGQCVAKLANGATCTAADECVSAACTGGLCVGGGGSGTPCTTGDQCTTGICVDGVCCAAACSGACEACNEPGTAGHCVAVKGVPRGTRTACEMADAGICNGECNGTNTSVCTFPTGKACASTCVGNSLTTATCGGGSCNSGGAGSCPNNLLCADDTSCKANCSADTDCIQGFVCSGGKCTPKGGARCVGDSMSQNSSASGDAGVTDCTPYLCDQGSGSCLQQCSKVGDCLAPNVCSASGECVAQASGSGSAGSTGGCTASPEGGSGSDGLFLVGAAVMLSAGRRRRRAA
jgi:hypothetical protein